ncbi:MAG: NAD-dependent epimerase/dehydratase family protein [Bacteroidota bacterium]
MPANILIIGAAGQIGSELTYKLRHVYGADRIIATDINDHNTELVNSGMFELLDAKDYDAIRACVEKYRIDTIYLMAAMLSATGEKYPMKAWDLNMTSLFNVLNLAKEGLIKKIFWPSSIAVFGPTTSRLSTPQHAVCEPTTVYGITKQVGERWCEYYHKNYNVDVRSIRYPGIISYKTMPGGGTTDYAVEIYHQAILEGHYNCFLSEHTRLPMMFMEDAIHATISLMEAPTERISIRSGYNLAAVSFTPKELYTSIKHHLPEFTINYSPDFRQHIAESWPQTIDDSKARADWNWKHRYDLDATTAEMIKQLKLRYNSEEQIVL